MATEAEKQFIRENYLQMPKKAMARKLGRSDWFVKYWLDKMGLEVPESLARKFHRESCYKKGHKPWNKGIKWEDQPKACKATQFKKGNKPHTTKKEDGIVTVRHEGDTGKTSYKYIRIEEGHWELYHRVIYELYYGDIPKDHIVAFKDGDAMNCDPENLELITREENMRRNSIMRYPEELRKSMRALGKLKSKINAKEQSNGSE